MSLTKAAAALQFHACDFFGTNAKPFNSLPSQTQRRSKPANCNFPFLVSHSYYKNAESRVNGPDGFFLKPLVVEARANARTESAKIRNRRIQKKFNGTPTKPRLSVFCSDKQLYAMLVDDQNKKCLFYGSTLQQSIRGNGTTIEAAERVGEELIKTCITLNITEISSYDRNGSRRVQRMQAFEIPISRHGFLR